MLEIRTLEKTNFKEITEIFNASFSDYFVPVKLTQEQIESKFLSEGGRLDLSVGAFENNKLVGFILNFIEIVNDEKMNYNGGTGVIPEFRGKRLTTKMYKFMMPLLKKEKVDKMILEVFTQNTSAIKIYQSQGFQTIRELSFYRGKLIETKLNKLDESYKIVKLYSLNWNKLKSFWDHAPTWQSSNATMDMLQKQNLHIGIMKEDDLVGYAIYNPKIKRVHQMAIDKEYRNLGLGNHLLNLISKIEQQDISVLNVDLRMESFNVLLKNRGLKNQFNQFEMVKTLNKK